VAAAAATAAAIAAAAEAAAAMQGAQPLSAREMQRPRASGNSPMAKPKGKGTGRPEGHLTADSAPTDESMYGALAWVVQPPRCRQREAQVLVHIAMIIDMRTDIQLCVHISSSVVYSVLFPLTDD
jgi:hypothetical protein